MQKEFKDCTINLAQEDQKKISQAQEEELIKNLSEPPQKSLFVRWTSSIIKNTFSFLDYHMNSIPRLLKKLAFSFKKGRRTHPLKDLAAIEVWKKSVFIKLQETKERFPDKKISLWHQDEARIGQKTKISYSWSPIGKRHPVPLSCGFSSVQLFGIFNAKNGSSFFSIFPRHDKETMRIFLEEFSKTLGLEEYALIQVDGAAYHSFKEEELPKNIGLIKQPPYSPELNMSERVWLHGRENYLNNIVFKNYEEIEERAVLVCQEIQSNPDLIRSLGDGYFFHERLLEENMGN